MRTITSLADMSEAVALARASGKTIGLVPTMGFLHEGHLSLVRASRRATDVTAVSLFVNPLQFGPKEDFREYPRDLARDSALLQTAGADILFTPEAAEMYPPGFQTFVEVRDLQDKLCGRSRPGHFRGVCTVVLKLFDIVRPDKAFFGQKDAQQALIIKRFVRDLNLGVAVEVCPIVRESDGLALSSRNTYLGPDERRAATVLWRGLQAVRRAYADGERSADALGRRIADLVAAEPLARVDYIAVVDPETLDPLDRLDGPALVALAVFIGRTRLIDNTLLGSAA